MFYTTCILVYSYDTNVDIAQEFISHGDHASQHNPNYCLTLWSVLKTNMKTFGVYHAPQTVLLRMER